MTLGKNSLKWDKVKNDCKGAVLTGRTPEEKPGQ